MQIGSFQGEGWGNMLNLMIVGTCLNIIFVTECEQFHQCPPVLTAGQTVVPHVDHIQQQLQDLTGEVHNLDHINIQLSMPAKLLTF